MYDMNIKLLKRIKTAANSTTEEIHETIDEIENRSYTTIRYNNNALNIMILPKGKDVTLEM
jgi:frataxin-like iron-binding protein CyaY